MINKVNWQDAIFFFDVDDTLIETASNSIAAANGIFELLKLKIGKDKASLVTERFKKIFNILVNQHWVNKSKENQEYEKVMNKINSLQKSVIENYGSIRKWSREVFLKISADDLGIKLTPDLIYQSINNYWAIISERSIPIKGVISFFNEIRIHNRPIYLVTGSDARLTLNNQGLFEYNPKYSERLKEQRIIKLKEKGILFDGISIGDPEDKPHLDFFQKAIRMAEDDLSYKINNKHLIMLGDSYSADLQTPREKLGFGLVVLYRKGQKEINEEGDQYIATGDVSQVKQYLQ